MLDNGQGTDIRTNFVHTNREKVIDASPSAKNHIGIQQYDHLVIEERDHPQLC